MPSSHTWASPPPQYRAVEVPNEATPLNGSPQDHTHKRKHTRWGLLVTIFFLFVLGPVISVHLLNDWKNSDGPAIRERERRRVQWGEEDRERERQRVAEDRERDRQLAEEDRERERERAQWGEEDLERERERVAKDRERERRRIEADLEHGRKQAREDFERRRKQAAEDSERERRQAEEDKEHERRLAKWAEEDRARLEDEERRMRTAVYWEGPTPADECLRYGTRMYSARLMNIPPGADGRRWCQETEITIHEDYIAKPDFCSEESGEVFGHWLKMNEPTCKNIWEDFSDKGCLAKGSQKRRVEAKLGFLEYIKGPWREMCTTTPADFWGRHSAGPDTCADTGGRVLGVWLVDDGEC